MCLSCDLETRRSSAAPSKTRFLQSFTQAEIPTCAPPIRRIPTPQKLTTTRMEGSVLRTFLAMRILMSCAIALQLGSCGGGGGSQATSSVVPNETSITQTVTAAH